jgi:transposase-like protein
MTQAKVEVKCPDCGNPMHKSGFAWSGKKRVQRYKCNKCGRTTIKEPGEDNQTGKEAKGRR